MVCSPWHRFNDPTIKARTVSAVMFLLPISYLYPSLFVVAIVEGRSYKKFIVKL